jgi:hypothetical protein
MNALRPFDASNQKIAQCDQVPEFLGPYGFFATRVGWPGFGAGTLAHEGGVLANFNSGLNHIRAKYAKRREILQKTCDFRQKTGEF